MVSACETSGTCPRPLEYEDTEELIKELLQRSDMGVICLFSSVHGPWELTVAAAPYHNKEAHKYVLQEALSVVNEESWNG